MKSSLLSRIPSAAAALAVLTLGGCSGLSLDSTELTAPAIGLGPAPATCTAVAGGGSLAIDGTATRVMIGRPNADPPNVIDVVGTVSGLAPSVNVYVVMVDDNLDCPILANGVVQATVTGGSFTAQIDLGDYTAVRVVAIASSATQAEITCTANDCINTGTSAPAAISEAITILL